MTNNHLQTVSNSARALILVAVVSAAIGQFSWAQTAASPQVASQTVSADSKLAAWMQSIALELRALRLELLEERCERQQARLREVERELELVHNQQRELEEEQSAEAQQTTEIDAHLAQSNLSSQEREDLQSEKSDLLAAGQARFGSSRVALSQREAQVRERITIEQQRVQFLAQQAQKLQPDKK
jgi:hypothetical protein